MSRLAFRGAVAAIVLSLLIAGGCGCAAEALAQTSVPGGPARAAPDAGQAACQVGQALGTLMVVMLMAFILLVVAVRVLFIFWPRGKPHARNACAGCALFVVVTTLIVVGLGCRQRSRVPAQGSATLAAAPGAPPPAAADPSVLAAAPARDPRAARSDQEPQQVFAAKGCRLSAPASWTAQAGLANADAKLVIASPTGEASVGIHFEPAAGTTLSKRDIARLMAEAKRMPLVLEDSNWSLVDNHDAWREVRAGSLQGSSRLWIRYSYHLDKAVVQVIGVASGNRSREARGLLETIVRSAHCEP
jgi:hypothetical protein